MIWEVFIAPETCHFAGVEGLKSYFLLIALIKYKYILSNIKWETNIFYKILIKIKYLLYNINGDGNMVNP
jgi:hypothetical protein